MEQKRKYGFIGHFVYKSPRTFKALQIASVYICLGPLSAAELAKLQFPNPLQRLVLSITDIDPGVIFPHIQLSVSIRLALVPG